MRWGTARRGGADKVLAREVELSRAVRRFELKRSMPFGTQHNARPLPTEFGVE
jgi:hypothetical protein